MMHTKDNLEERIRAQAEEIFGSSEPPAGHRERFTRRLEDARRATRHRRLRQIWRLTLGAVALAAAVALVAVWLWSRAGTVSGGTDDDVTESPVEVQRYYAMRLDDELEVTRALINRHPDSDDRRALLDELHALQAEDVPEVQLTDDEQITLIVRVYSSKIDVLQRIQARLSTNNHNKEES